MRTLCLLLLGCAACSSNSLDHDGDVPAALAALESSVDRAELTAKTDIAVNTAPSFDDIATADAARAIYDATIALPVFPPGPTSCPADFGITYTLVFHAGADLVLTAALDPNGCGEVTFTPDDGKERRTYTPGSDYWATLATSFGVPEATLEYSPPEN